MLCPQVESGINVTILQSLTDGGTQVLRPVRGIKPAALIKSGRREIFESMRGAIDKFVINILRKVDLQEQRTVARQTSIA